MKRRKKWKWLKRRAEFFLLLKMLLSPKLKAIMSFSTVSSHVRGDQTDNWARTNIGANIQFLHIPLPFSPQFLVRYIHIFHMNLLLIYFSSLFAAYFSFVFDFSF